MPVAFITMTWDQGQGGGTIFSLVQLTNNLFIPSQLSLSWLPPAPQQLTTTPASMMIAMIATAGTYYNTCCFDYQHIMPQQLLLLVASPAKKLPIANPPLLLLFLPQLFLLATAMILHMLPLSLPLPQLWLLLAATCPPRLLPAPPHYTAMMSSTY